MSQWIDVRRCHDKPSRYQAFQTQWDVLYYVIPGFIIIYRLRTLFIVRLMSGDNGNTVVVFTTGNW